MRDLEAIAELYAQVDNFLDELRDRYDTAGQMAERDRVARQQKLNEQAYFVLAWGQLEAEIGEACRDAIRLGRAHDEWRHRRTWSLYDPKNLRLSFRHRLALVLDQSSSAWKMAIEHYEVRNQIAHGDLRSEGIEVSTVIENFYRIRSSLARD